MNKHNITWYYHYIQSCKEVSSSDLIDITDDKFGRWQIRGKIDDNTCLFINKNNGGFSCNFNNNIIYGENPNDVIIKIENIFNQ